MLIKDQVEEKLKVLTKHKFVHITDRCNSAIFVAMSIAKNASESNKILIPDQGGWFSYKKYPKYFDLEIVEVRTDKGVIDLEDLKEKVKDASGFIFSSFAGYYAEQPLEGLSSICREAGCLIIEDASGSVGDETLCNGDLSDIIVGSFGQWKPVDCGCGGFISISNSKLRDLGKDALSISKVHPATYEEILKGLESNKLRKLLELQKHVKEELKEFEIFHKDKRGVNVVVAKNPEIIKYCDDKNYPYVICPKYIRVNEEAISIELKRLDL